MPQVQDCIGWLSPSRRRRSHLDDVVPFSVFNPKKTSKSVSSDSKLVEAPKRKCDPASESNSVSKKSTSASSLAIRSSWKRHRNQLVAIRRFWMSKLKWTTTMNSPQAEA